MKIVEIIAKIKEYENIDELNSSQKELILQARKFCDNAYAPYSNYYVGASVLLENGKIINGNNQENVAYPSGLCAERVAVFYASANYPGVKIKSLAVTSKSKNFTVNSPVTPCGACRQVLAEYEKIQNQKIEIILTGEIGKILVIESANDLLPLSFSADELKNK